MPCLYASHDTVYSRADSYKIPASSYRVACTKHNELEANAANLDASERRDLDRLTAQITECREYHDRLHEVADEQIGFDLDDGVVVNYAKFGDVLQKIK